MDDDTTSDENDTRRLIAGPALVLHLVAGADGVVDAKERACCHAFLEEYASSGRNACVRDLLGSSRDQLEDLSRACARADLGESLRALRAACEWQLDERTRIAYVKVLMELAQHIAEASGSFLGLGDPVSAVERRALQRLRQALL